MKTAIITTWLEPDERKALKKFAHQQETNVSTVVREAIAAYIAQKKEKKDADNLPPLSE